MTICAKFYGKEIFECTRGDHCTCKKENEQVEKMQKYHNDFMKLCFTEREVLRWMKS